MTSASGEEARIRAVLEAVPTASGVFGAGDDAAALPDAQGRRVLTTDAMVEGVHFLRAHPPAALGWKLLAVNVSDVAAMGARSEGFTLTAALPGDLPEGWWAAFCRGLGACAARYGVRVVGGDTVRSPGPVFLSVTAWGVAAGETLLTRTGGRPGDVLMVHGPIGRAGVGLERWLAVSAGLGWAGDEPLPDDPCVAWHLAPRPDPDAGPWALANGATAGMDLSDGLLTDLPRLARASGVALTVDLDRLPADDALAGVPADVRAAGGEDYGLVVLVPEDLVATFEARGFVALGTTGEATEGPPVVWRAGGRDVTPAARAFEHFPPAPGGAESCDTTGPDLGSEP